MSSARRASLLASAERHGLVLDEYVEPVKRHVVVGGHRLHLLDWCGAGASPVLFVHGVRLTAHTFDLVSLAMRNRWRPYALDLRGHGESEWSSAVDYRPAVLARDVIGIIEHVGGPVRLVGQSLGGVVSVIVALERPDLVEQLVLVDVAPPGEARRRSSSSRAARDVGIASEFDTIDDAVDAVIGLNPRRERDRLRVSLRNNLREMVDGRLTWKYDSRGFGPAASFDFEALKRMWTRFGEIEHEVLVVRGAESPVVLPEDVEGLPRRFPKVQLAEIPGAGHNVQGDNPPALVREIEAFFAR